MAEIFRFVTPVIYWILIVLWSFILCFYVKKMWDSKTKQLFHALVVILAIDAFRTLFESLYFGLWYTSLSGLIPIQIGDFLTRPELVIIPKIINVVAAVIIIVLLFKRWLPREELEQNMLWAAKEDKEEEFRALFENNPVSCWLEDFTEVQKRFEVLREEGIFDIDAYFNEYPEKLVELSQAIIIKAVNQATLDLHQAESKEQLYQGLDKIFTSESFEVFRKEIVDVWNGKTQNSHDGWVKTPDGDLRYVQINYKILPGYENTLEKILISIVDNTQKWLAEQKLQQSELKFRALFEQSGGYCMILDPNTSNGIPVIIDANESACQMHGYKREEFIGRPVSDLDDEDGKRLIKKRTAEMMTGKPLYAEIEHLRKDGTSFSVAVNAKRIDIGDGEPLILTTEYDITERKRAEDALRESEARFRKMIEKSPLPMLITNQNHDIVFFNDRFIELFGYTLEDISTAEEWWHAVYPELEYRQRVQESWQAAMEEAGAAGTDVGMREWDLTTKDGTSKRCEFYMVPLEEVSLIIMNDISKRISDELEKKKLELRLQQAEKMESIGTLAGGIAHDFNNILSAILGYSQIVKEELPDGSRADKDIDMVIQSSMRAAELVKQILTFSRKSEHQLQALTPHPIIKEALQMLRSALPTTIEIKEDIDKECGDIEADPTNIHQIMVNLCSNALHAMDQQKGTLTVRLSRETLETDDVEAYENVAPGSFVLLSVSDTGHGMDTKTMQRVFEPYFTTKEVGEGSGIGLAVIHGIVQDCKGFIRVVSKPGYGSTFSVYLPVLEETSADKDDKVTPQKIKVSSPQVGGRIIIIDDEELLVRLNKRRLEYAGYTVTATTDSEEALEKIRAHPEQFDLLITDQTMPNMSGVELTHEVQKINPDMPAIMSTGHSDLVTKEEALKMGISKYLLKPIQGNELIDAVGELLDEK